MADDRQSTYDLERRSLLKKAAVVAGASMWATPTIQSIASPAFATGSPQVCTETVGFKINRGQGFDTYPGAGPHPGNGNSCQPTGCGDTVYSVPQGSATTQCVTVPGLGSYCVTASFVQGNDRIGTITITPPAGKSVQDVSARIKTGMAGPGCVDPVSTETLSNGAVRINLNTGSGKGAGISNIIGCFCAAR